MGTDFGHTSGGNGTSRSARRRAKRRARKAALGESGGGMRVDAEAERGPDLAASAAAAVRQVDGYLEGGELLGMDGGTAGDEGGTLEAEGSSGSRGGAEVVSERRSHARAQLVALLVAQGYFSDQRGADQGLDMGLLEAGAPRGADEELRLACDRFIRSG